MKERFTKSKWQFRTFFGSEEDVSRMLAAGIKPVRAQGNDGSVSVITDSGEHIATVTCQTKVKRGEGSTVVCEERDANARLIAKAPQLYATLREVVDLYTPTQRFGGEWVYPNWYPKAKAIIEEVGGDL